MTSVFFYKTTNIVSPQVDEFIIKSIKWTSSSQEDELILLSPQMGKFITKSTSGQVYYKVHKQTSLLLRP